MTVGRSLKVRAIEGDEERSSLRCFKCWNLLVASLEDTIEELESKGFDTCV